MLRDLRGKICFLVFGCGLAALKGVRRKLDI